MSLIIDVDYEIKFCSPHLPTTPPETPFGKLPMLEVDGAMVVGSLGIARLLAERFGKWRGLNQNHV